MLPFRERIFDILMGMFLVPCIVVLGLLWLLFNEPLAFFYVLALPGLFIFIGWALAHG